MQTFGFFDPFLSKKKKSPTNKSVIAADCLLLWTKCLFIFAHLIFCFWGDVYCNLSLLLVAMEAAFCLDVSDKQIFPQLAGFPRCRPLFRPMVTCFNISVVRRTSSAGQGHTKGSLQHDVLLWKKYGIHQLRLAVYPIIYLGCAGVLSLAVASTHLVLKHFETI